MSIAVGKIAIAVVGLIVAIACSTGPSSARTEPVVFDDRKPADTGGGGGGNGDKHNPPKESAGGKGDTGSRGGGGKK